MNLQTLLGNSVVEIRFRRRNPKKGWAMNRRMICTNNWALLNSAPGKLALHFARPSKPRPYDPAAHNLVFAWDLFWQNWRAISLEQHDIIGVIPVRTEEERVKFWQYFNLILQGMSSTDKSTFMNT